MTAPIEERLPDVSDEQRAADESVKFVRKLRWMGMESEVNLREAKQREGSGDCGMPPHTQGHVSCLSQRWRFASPPRRPVSMTSAI
jgi:hypothetical protein